MCNGISAAPRTSGNSLFINSPTQSTNHTKAKSTDDLLKRNRNEEIIISVTPKPNSMGGAEDIIENSKPNPQEASEKRVEPLPINPRPEIMPVKPTLVVNNTDICRPSRSDSRSRSRSKSPLGRNSRDQRNSNKHQDFCCGEY